jgi:hypothetical protein
VTDRHYADIKPSATDAQILRAGHYCVVGFAIFMGAFDQFSKKFFRGWVIVSLLWAFFSFGSVTLYPIIEERHCLLSSVKEFSPKPKAEEIESVDEVKVEHEGKDTDI